jgi:anthranilate synthase component 1
VPEGLPPTLACLVGYFGYETIGLVEKLPRPAQSTLELPDMLFVRPTVVLVFDRLTDELTAVAPVWAEGGDPQALLALAADRIDAALARLHGPCPPNRVCPKRSTWCASRRWRRTLARWSPARGLHHRGRYLPGGAGAGASPRRSRCRRWRSIARCGGSTLAVPLFPRSARLCPDRLQPGNPGAHPRWRSDHPPHRRHPPARRHPAEDRANEESLLADPKERAEHLMLLDLGRNDVGRVAAAGTVKVTESYTIERYSHVMHIVSNVVGQLDTGGPTVDALLAGFRRHGQRSAQGARLRDHRRTRTRNARRLCRRRRLFRARWLGR